MEGVHWNCSLHVNWLSLLITSGLIGFNVSNFKINLSEEINIIIISLAALTYFNHKYQLFIFHLNLCEKSHGRQFKIKAIRTIF